MGKAGYYLFCVFNALLFIKIIIIKYLFYEGIKCRTLSYI